MLYWNPELFRVGIDQIDQQHQRLLGALDELHRAYEHGTIAAELPRLLEFLAAYSAEHFQTEEELMKAYTYSGLAEQQAEHNQFIQSLHGYQEQFKATGASLKLALTIFNDLSQWLVEHISTNDRAMGLAIAPQIKDS